MSEEIIQPDLYELKAELLKIIDSFKAFINYRISGKPLGKDHKATVHKFLPTRLRRFMEAHEEIMGGVYQIKNRASEFAAAKRTEQRASDEDYQKAARYYLEVVVPKSSKPLSYLNFIRQLEKWVAESNSN